MEICEYQNFGRCARIERNSAVAMVTLDIGPRIIYYGTREFNFLNEDICRNVSKEGEYFDKTYSKGEKWYLYGGHRVWKSPEDMESYTPDNYPVEAQLREYGGTFTTRAGAYLDFSLDVDMDEKGRLNITNTIINKGNQRRRLAVWALTVVAKRGKLIVPLNHPEDDLNPYQNIVKWPYNDPDDERLTVGRKYLILRQTERENAIKIGLFSKKGRAYYVIGDKALKFDYLGKNGVYGDFWCNFESYTNRHILEVEGLGPLCEMDTGDHVSTQEKWELICNMPEFGDDEESLAALEAHIEKL